MKSPQFTRSEPRKNGFTLVELLVVIAIIAVLAATGFTVGTGAINKARKLTAETAASSVATAIEQFYSEYSALPDPGTNTTDQTFTTNGGDGVALLSILAGKGSGDQNTRGINFLSIKNAKNGRGGLEYTGDDISALVDPWGQPYTIVLDYDYDNQLEDIETVDGVDPVTLRGVRVAVWSAGVADLADADAKTLAKTW